MRIRISLRHVVFICLALMSVRASADEDLFVGVFESETRENFGTDTAGEYRIEVMAISGGKYVAAIYHREGLLGRRELIRCPVAHESRFNDRPPGRAEVLCSVDSASLPAFISYSENGINVPVMKPKYRSNPELAKQDRSKFGGSSLFEVRQHRTKYYAHVRGATYGFRKIQ